MEWVIIIILVIWLLGLSSDNSDNESDVTLKDNSPKKNDGFLSQFNTGLNELNAGLKELNESLAIKRIVFKKTKELGFAIHHEKILINNTLKLARVKIESEILCKKIEEECKNSDEFRRIYNVLSNGNDEQFENITKQVEVQERGYFKPPNFATSIVGFNEKVTKEIKEKVLELKEDRGEFLKDVQRELKSDSCLKQEFFESLRNYPEIISLFSANGEWRKIVSHNANQHAG